jgi:acrylyl-CoA reductase (NADPH)
MKRRRCCLADYQQGWWVSGDSSGAASARLRTNISRKELGDDTAVSLRVLHSAVNYKDALALTGAPGIIRSMPLIPGIDAVGEVLESPDPRFSPGDTVVLTGWGYGEVRNGGLCTGLAADPGDLLHLPSGLTSEQGAAFGTAGITAALAVSALKNAGLEPGGEPVAVTGAAGAVGSFAIMLLAKQGYSVTAITGRTDEAEYLRSLGATEVISRQEVLSWPVRPLMKERFAGAIDQAGGPLLASLLASTLSSGVVASCGLAGGVELHTTVMPFILRGITLVGINSVYQRNDVRERIWSELETLSPEIPWEDIITMIDLADAETTASQVLAGVTRGRVVVQMPV